MVVFFSDLDNTLIFSHRRNVNGEKVVAELLNGKQQSYMLIRVLDYFRKYNSIQILPVTTRTIEQYSRINILGEQLCVKKALVCNGGVLLDDGIIDEKWRHETYSICESNNELSEIERLWKLINYKYADEKIVYVDKFMFYIITDKASEISQYLSVCMNVSRVSLVRGARKIYVIASSVNKGACVKRYIKQAGINEAILAGDSEFDIPMLDLGYPSIAANSLRGKIKNSAVIYSEGEILAAEIDKLIDKITNR